MAHFNVLKGTYPGLAQLDKTLPIKAGETTIQRGSILVIDAGSFRQCVAADAGGAGAPGPVVYHAFQNQSDPDVVMANGVTGMPCIAPVEIESDMYTGKPAVGNFLMCIGTAPATNLGKLAVCTDNHTAVGLVTKAQYTRWSNVATPAGGSYPSARQGATINVIAYWSMYIPNLLVV